MLTPEHAWPLQSVLVATGLAMSPLVASVGWAMRSGRFSNALPRTSQMAADVPPFVARARAAHANNLETLGLYAGGMAAGVAAGVPPGVLGRLATSYVVGRAAYNVLYVGGEAWCRTGGYARSAVYATLCLGPCLRLWAAAAGEAAALGKSV
eukprot:contig_28655_g7049